MVGLIEKEMIDVGATLLNVRIEGFVPLLMHNVEASNPQNKITKQIKPVKSRRGKSEAEEEFLSVLDWLGSVYWKEIGNLEINYETLSIKGLESFSTPLIPSRVLEAALINSASKCGFKGITKSVIKSSLVINDNPELIYDGPKNAKEMLESGEFSHCSMVVVNKARIPRFRGYFDNWEVDFKIEISNDLTPEIVQRLLEIAGSKVGICDWRPKYGRFNLKSIEVI